MNVLRAEEAWSVLKKGGSARLPDSSKAKFAPGDVVVARKFNHPGHIRLPEYVQGHRGRIAADHGVFVFPDQHAAGSKEPQRLYCVRFEAVQLWGEKSSPQDAVYVDLFEPYLIAEE